MNAQALSKNEQTMHQVLKNRWLSAKANATGVSVLEETIEESTETGF